MTPIRTLIVDDVALARRALARLLGVHPDVALVGEAASGREAIAMARTLMPDLLLLDVQMPEIDGFDVLQALTGPAAPLTVLVTAYDAHALRAFEARAIDYLLKPVEAARLAAALARTRTMLRGRVRGSFAVERPDPPPQRLAFKVDRRTVLLEATAIDRVVADGNYVHIHSGARRYMVRLTMAEAQSMLAPFGFERVHRSALVNVARIAALQTTGERSFVMLADGSSASLSRGRRRIVASRLRSG